MALRAHAAVLTGDVKNTQPDWWERQLPIMNFIHDENVLMLVSASTEFTILPLQHNHWLIGWKKTRTRYGGNPLEFSSGAVVLNRAEMYSAFGFYGQAHEFDSTLANMLRRRYRADVCALHKFMRTGPYLIFPGPGTGAVGDPNVSIEITDQIKKEILSMLGPDPRAPKTADVE